MPLPSLPAVPLAPSLIPPADEVPALVRLTGAEQEIWDRALPYLDVRDNAAHSLHSHSLARALLTAMPQARADIVLPAVLLHDTGWKRVDPAARPQRDAVVKDADKLWRLTPHGLRTVGSWFTLDAEQTLRLVLSLTYDRLLTETGRAIGRALVACAVLDHSPRRSGLRGRAPIGEQ
jgi:hypothetical protein